MFENDYIFKKRTQMPISSTQMINGRNCFHNKKDVKNDIFQSLSKILRLNDGER